MFVMSTCEEDGMVEVVREGKRKLVPIVVNSYNNNMGGVDRSDQMLHIILSWKKTNKKKGV